MLTLRFQRAAGVRYGGKDISDNLSESTEAKKKKKKRQEVDGN